MDSLETSIVGVKIKPLDRIKTLGGDVLHGLKVTDSDYCGFGEAYFSMIEKGAIKAWKRHKEMRMNIISPTGTVKFVVFDDRFDSASRGLFEEFYLSPENYVRLHIPPMLWVGFMGVGIRENVLLNISDILHSPAEVDRKDVGEIIYDW